MGFLGNRRTSAGCSSSGNCRKSTTGTFTVCLWAITWTADPFTMGKVVQGFVTPNDFRQTCCRACTLSGPMIFKATGMLQVALSIGLGTTVSLGKGQAVPISDSGLNG